MKTVISVTFFSEETGFENGEILEMGEILHD